MLLSGCATESCIAVDSGVEEGNTYEINYQRALCRHGLARIGSL